MSQSDPGDGVPKDGSGEHGQVVQGNVHYDAQQQGVVQNHSVMMPYLGQQHSHSLNALVPNSIHQSSAQFTVPMMVPGPSQPMSPGSMQKHATGVGQWPSVAFSRGPDKKKRQREDFNQSQLKRLIEVTIVSPPPKVLLRVWGTRPACALMRLSCALSAAIPS